MTMETAFMIFLAPLLVVAAFAIYFNAYFAAKEMISTVREALKRRKERK